MRDRYTGNRWELIDQACRMAEARGLHYCPTCGAVEPGHPADACPLDSRSVPEEDSTMHPYQDLIAKLNAAGFVAEFDSTGGGCWQVSLLGLDGRTFGEHRHLALTAGGALGELDERTGEVHWELGAYDEGEQVGYLDLGLTDRPSCDDALVESLGDILRFIWGTAGTEPYPAEVALCLDGVVVDGCPLDDDPTHFGVWAHGGDTPIGTISRDGFRYRAEAFFGGPAFTASAATLEDAMRALWENEREQKALFEQRQAERQSYRFSQEG